jgi:predicted helicase
VLISIPRFMPRSGSGRDESPYEGDYDPSDVRPFLYRPLDYRKILYQVPRLQRARYDIMKHFVLGRNVALSVPRQAEEEAGGFVTKAIMGHKTYSAYNRNYCFPLYLYPAQNDVETERRVNFDPKIYAEIRERAGLKPSPVELRSTASQGGGGSGEAAEGEGASIGSPTLAPSPNLSPEGERDQWPDELRVFDYIYGVLHSPDYRRTYAQFLKIDFPRIPYPASPEVFAHVADKGGQLRRLHLMEAQAIGATPYPFKGEGDGVLGSRCLCPLPLRGEEGAAKLREERGRVVARLHRTPPLFPARARLPSLP